MSSHKHYYENDADLEVAYENGIKSGSIKESFDDWKYDTFRHSKGDYDWSNAHEDMYEKGEDDNDVRDKEHDGE